MWEASWPLSIMSDRQMRVGLGVELLAEHLQPRLRVEGAQVILGDREHPAGPARRVAERLDDARLGEDVLVLDEEQVHHQPDDLARVKCSPAVSFDSSENRRISSS